MTAPAQPQQPPQQQDPAQDAVAVTAIAAVLVSAVSAAAAVTALTGYLSGLPDKALEAALDVVMGFPPEQAGASGPATLIVSRLNLIRRAQFVLASARRLTGDMAAARSNGVSMIQALQAGISRERRFYGQHLQAGWNRAKAASQVDSAASTYGLLLGWNARLDKVTSAECRAANGKNFLASSMPLIGFPGMVHPHCRCYPGKARPGAAMLPSAGRRLRAVA
jgi:hypothetical protein